MPSPALHAVVGVPDGLGGRGHAERPEQTPRVHAGPHAHARFACLGPQALVSAGGRGHGTPHVISGFSLPFSRPSPWVPCPRPPSAPWSVFVTVWAGVGMPSAQSRLPASTPVRMPTPALPASDLKRWSRRAGVGMAPRALFLVFPCRFRGLHLGCHAHARPPRRGRCS